MLARAREHPLELVVGVDAVAGAMLESSRRASRRHLQPNAIFVASAVERLPAGLCAQLVTIHFPWGSLLRGATGADPAMATRIATLLRPGGMLRVLISAAARDAGDGLAALAPAEIERRYADLGLRTISSRPATVEDARAAHSSWGKRLLAQGGERRAWLLELLRG